MPAPCPNCLYPLLPSHAPHAWVDRDLTPAEQADRDAAYSALERLTEAHHPFCPCDYCHARMLVCDAGELADERVAYEPHG